MKSVYVNLRQWGRDSKQWRYEGVVIHLLPHHLCNPFKSPLAYFKDTASVVLLFLNTSISASHLGHFLQHPSRLLFLSLKNLSQPHFSCKVSSHFFICLYSITLRKSILCFASPLPLLLCSLKTSPAGTRPCHSSTTLLLQGINCLHIIQSNAYLSESIILDQESLQ